MDALKLVLFGAAATVAFLSISMPAQAKPARCFTTDDGHYSCDFRGLDGAGSFTVEADGYPTYTLEVDQPGLAFGFADFGDGNVSLPGQYVRQSDDPPAGRTRTPARRSAPGRRPCSSACQVSGRMRQGAPLLPVKKCTKPLAWHVSRVLLNSRFLWQIGRGVSPH